MKFKCQCPERHCTNEFEESEESSVDLYPLSDESTIDTEQDIRYLESKTHLAICPMCSASEHQVFE
jgi:hypothetical protein